MIITVLLVAVIASLVFGRLIRIKTSDSAPHWYSQPIDRNVTALELVAHMSKQLAKALQELATAAQVVNTTMSMRKLAEAMTTITRTGVSINDIKTRLRYGP